MPAVGGPRKFKTQLDPADIRVAIKADRSAKRIRTRTTLKVSPTGFGAAGGWTYGFSNISSGQKRKTMRARKIDPEKYNEEYLNKQLKEMHEFVQRKKMAKDRWDRLVEEDRKNKLIDARKKQLIAERAAKSIRDQLIEERKTFWRRNREEIVGSDKEFEKWLKKSIFSRITNIKNMLYGMEDIVRTAMKVNDERDERSAWKEWALREKTKVAIKNTVMEYVDAITEFSIQSVTTFFITEYKFYGEDIAEFFKDVNKEFNNEVSKEQTRMAIEVEQAIKKEIIRAGLVDTWTLHDSVFVTPINTDEQINNGNLEKKITFQVGMVNYGWILEWGSRNIKPYRFVFKGLSAVSSRYPSAGFEMLL